MSTSTSNLETKIEKLLRDPPSVECPEPMLVALVLLLRLPDAANVWKGERGDQLRDFGHQLVQHHEGRLQALFLSLVAQVSPATSKDVDFWFEALQYRHDAKLPVCHVDCDVLCALEGSLKQQKVAPDALDQSLARLWRIHHREASNSDEPGDDTTDPAQAMMVETLSRILLSNNGSTVKDWHELLVGLLGRFGRALVENHHQIPWVYTKILSWWTKSTRKDRAYQERRRLYAPVVLLLTQAVFGVAVCREKILKDQTTLESLHAVIVSCIISTKANSDSLRYLAWSTVAAVAASPAQWTWLPAPTTQNGLNPACTLARMASGEWRIQLGQVLDKPSMVQDDMLLLLQSTARVLELVIDMVISLANESETKALYLSLESIMHLRRSLEEALDACVQYLCLCGESPPAVHPVVRVLGSLLKELDPFEMRPKGQEGVPALQALRRAIDLVPAQCTEFLVPAFAMALDGIFEDDLERMQLLKEYDLVGRPLHKFVRQAWKEEPKQAPIIPWLCRVTEAWFLSAPVADSREILRYMLVWIQSTLLLVMSAQEREALTAALGTFVLLHGDEPPNGEASFVLQQAYELCGGFC